MKADNFMITNSINVNLMQQTKLQFKVNSSIPFAEVIAISQAA